MVQYMLNIEEITHVAFNRRNTIKFSDICNQLAVLVDPTGRQMRTPRSSPFRINI